MATTAVRGQRLANTLARMADRLEGKFRNAFLRSMISMADDPELKKLLKDIQAGKFTYGDSIDARLNAVKFDIAEMNEIARQAIAGSAKVTKDVMNLKGSFDVVNDAVIDAARNLSIELSTNLRKSTKESLRQVIEDLISGNINEAEALRRIQLEVGLLPQHTKAVNNYRRTLINAGTPRGRANQLAEQYAKRLLKYRANMISRTEVARATGVGQTQFWRQMRDQDALPSQANRVWITAMDERACPFCSSMNGQVASIDGGWETEKGYMEYPQGSHPHCRCSSGITMRKMTKTGKEGAISKVEEIEWAIWVSKHLGSGHDQSTHAGGNGKINWDSLYGDGIGGFMPDVREELEGYLSPQATSSLEDWVMDSKWPKKYFDEIRDEENPDHYDVLQSRLVEAGFPETVTITRRGTPNSKGDVRNGSAIEGWSGGSESGAHYGMDTKVYESRVPRKNIIGVGSLEEGEFFYINDSSVVTELRKHLAGQHDQSNHAGGRGLREMSATGGTDGKAPKNKTSVAKPKAKSNPKGLKLGVDYDEDGYPLDSEDGVVAQKLADIHGLYDEASTAAMKIANRGPKKLLMPRDENGLPQVLPLSRANRRYGKTPEAVIDHLEQNFGVKVRVSGEGKGTEHKMDMLHGVAQAVEELKLNGVAIDKMTDVLVIDMSPNVKPTTIGYWSYNGRSITINANNIPTGEVLQSSGSGARPPDKYFLADTPFTSSGYQYGEGAVRRAYATFIHESGHAMDNYVGRKIQETRKRIIDETFAGTDLLTPNWENTPRGRSILYDQRDVNATTYYGDVGAAGLVATRRDGTIDVNAIARSMVDDKVSYSEYATYNLRENFSETYTAYWLYGASKGKYRTYYDRYIDRVGNIVDMSQGIIKVISPVINDVIETNLALLPADHPLIVWFTGILPIE